MLFYPILCLIYNYCDIYYVMYRFYCYYILMQSTSIYISLYVNHTILMYS
jgi:hypothetical protein